MISDTGYGLAIVFLSGIAQGSVLMPMKYLRRWRWENIWLLYATFAYLLLPWLFALATVPHLILTFESTSSATLVRTLVFGLLWGLAVVTFGLGCELLGLALGYAIILGLGACVGSLVPLIGQHRDQLWARAGFGTMAGVVLLTGGVIMFSLAAKKREEAQRELVGGPEFAEAKGGLKANFVLGIVICIVCGVLSPLINIAFAYAAEIRGQAVKFGAAPSNAANAVWVLVANAGYIPSFCYCLFLLRKNKSWGLFAKSAERLWFIAPLMGFMWIFGTVLYGVGAIRMGQLGPVIGWPVVMSTMVLTANVWGLVAGEWRGVGGVPIRLATAGMATLIAAMFILGWSNKL
jgi:L-rhamnose-H+ transport protein